MSSSKRAFSLLEIMTVIAFMGIILAIALPTFFRSREISRMRGCQENMRKIDGAKQQWALDGQHGAASSPDWENLIGVGAYIRKSPKCPAGGTYTVGALAEDPACSLSATPPFRHTYEAVSTPGQAVNP